MHANGSRSLQSRKNPDITGFSRSETIEDDYPWPSDIFRSVSQLIFLENYDVVNRFGSVMVCGIVNLVSGVGPEEIAPSWLVFSQVFGTARLLVPLGIRMLMHQKETAENKPEASFTNPSDISMARFRSQEWVEDPVGSTGSIVRSDSVLEPADSHSAPWNGVGTDRPKVSLCTVSLRLSVSVHD